MLSLFRLNNKNTRATPIDVILVSLLLTFNKLVSSFYLEFWTCIYLVWKFTYNPMFHYSHCRCISWGYIINTTDDLNKTITIKLHFSCKIIKSFSHFLGNNYTAKKLISSPASVSWDWKLDFNFITQQQQNNNQIIFHRLFPNPPKYKQHTKLCRDKTRF